MVNNLDSIVMGGLDKNVLLSDFLAFEAGFSCYCLIGQANVQSWVFSVTF
jgi:hypothetical protein